MAKLATPHLKDVVPTPSGLATIPDRLITASLDSASQPKAVRITVAAESGAQEAALILTIGDDNGTPVWTDCAAYVASNVQPEVTARVNRLLKGFAFSRPSGPPSLVYSNPILGMDWRTKKVTAIHRRRRVQLPVGITAKPKFSPLAIATLWDIKQVPQVPIVASDPAFPVALTATKAQAKPARGRRSQPVKAAVPTIRQQVTPNGVEIDPMDEVTDSLLTPKRSVKANKPIPTAKPVASVLPANHPGIFQMATKSGPILHVEKIVMDDLNEAVASFRSGKRTVVLMRGPSGAGKTLAARTVAMMNGLPFKKFDVAGMRDFGDWTGTVSLRDSGSGVVTAFSPSQFAEGIMADGPYSGIPRMVLLDEVTRAETAGSMNALTGVLDGTGTLYVPDARKSINIDPAVLFVCTANIGAIYGGTVNLDEAIANRVTHWVVCDYPAAGVEVTILTEQAGVTPQVAQKLVNTAAQVRAMAVRGEIEFSISTRQLVEVGHRVTNGRQLVDAFRVSYIQRLSPEGDAASDVAKVKSAVNASLR